MKQVIVKVTLYIVGVGIVITGVMNNTNWITAVGASIIATTAVCDFK